MEFTLVRDALPVAEGILCAGMCGGVLFPWEFEGSFEEVIVSFWQEVVRTGRGGWGVMGCICRNLLEWFRRFCCLELCVHRLVVVHRRFLVDVKTLFSVQVNALFLVL